MVSAVCQDLLAQLVHQAPRVSKVRWVLRVNAEAVVYQASQDAMALMVELVRLDDVVHQA